MSCSVIKMTCHSFEAKTTCSAQWLMTTQPQNDWPFSEEK
jgi:hypothetical protein